MRIAKLRVHHFRCIEEIELPPEALLNWLVGPNGSGKTSLLEAIYLLSHGHSFRSGALDTLIQRNSTGFTIFAEIFAAGRTHTLGMARSVDGWQLRVDGQNTSLLSTVLKHCAAISFEPSSHELIAGPADRRRRFLDWGVFHVEHRSLDHWREYRRALRQRNALLRTGGPAEQFEIWEAELERCSTPIERERRSYIESLKPHLRQAGENLLPELGGVRFYYYAGWDTDRPLGAILAAQRDKDMERGHTRFGPHRADWRLIFPRAPLREHLSRGQSKLAALTCALAQGHLFAAQTGTWPILCLDDLASELDAVHQRAVFQEIAASGAQVWITATEPYAADISQFGTVFHVEHGSLCTH
ncbi:MAG TPA: DNA replication/repair protein RecF [Rhodanobacteraceae bacterium]|nr:DNA replication/repair protein RecF [Rhodanobacteraceae bacterium]